MSSKQLYNPLNEKMSELVKVKNRKQSANWIWIIVGIIQSESCNLSKIANYLPMETEAESRVTLVRRCFRDDKSRGLDMAHIRLQHAERINHLFLALASATIWRHELGGQVLAQGESVRRQIDPGLTRELSLFQLGLR